jgi:L-rhamnose isomerase
MPLRKHPLMTYKGHPNWPPQWIWISGPDKTKIPAVEFGTLENIQISNVLGTSLFLTVSMSDGNRYTGCLNFDSEKIASKILSILHSHLGETIKSIAEIDILSGSPNSYRSDILPRVAAYRDTGKLRF